MKRNTICPMSYDGMRPCDVCAASGCLGVMLAFAAALFFGFWLFSPPAPPEQPMTAPAEKPALEGGMPLFDAHWWSCPQCRAPLINDKGEESGGMCEEGFRLFQEDMRRKVK